MEDIGCYGHPIIQTPNIDKLAKNGLKCTNAILTASSCSPSRTSIITGRYPHNTGACELHSPIPKKQVVFPKLLQKQGYYTAQAGKWHFGAEPVDPSGVALNAFDRTGGSVKDGGGHSGAEKWVEYLQNRPKDQPFFMWFAAHDAHRKWDKADKPVEYTADNVIVPPYMVNDVMTRQDLACYYNEVTRFDYYIGKVIQELKNQDIFKNTMIIVMADNGRPFPRDKTRFYDSGIKTPFVIHCPQLLQHSGKSSNSLISSIDIAPTILEIAGCKILPNFQGESLQPLFRNEHAKIHEYVYAEHNWHDYMAYGRMIRTNEFLYIYNGRPNQNMVGPKDALDGGAGQSLKMNHEKGSLNDVQERIYCEQQPKEELYEFVNDSLQLNNLANTKGYKKTLIQLRKKLKQWQRTTRDTEPIDLTPDWYSRIDGKSLEKKGTRCSMPGAKKHATQVMKK